jgi:hypothetical protein
MFSETYDDLGIMLDPMIARANHCCLPNTYIVQDGPVVSLRAFAPILQGQEIFISYIPTGQPYYVRRLELKRSYAFDCQCSICRDGPNGEDDRFLKSPESVSEDFRKQCQSIDNLPEDTEGFIAGTKGLRPTNFLGETPELRLLAAAQASAFRASESLELDKIIAAIKFLEGSGMWPLRRFPLPNLYESLSLCYANKADFYNQFLVEAKRHIFINDYIYYRLSHPLRLVDMYKVYKLTLCVLDDERLAKYGEELLILFGMTMGELSMQVKQTFGPKSPFAISVMAKIEEDRPAFDHQVKLSPRIRKMFASLERNFPSMERSKAICQCCPGLYSILAGLP